MYIPISIKTQYELLSSLIKIDDLILYARKYNCSALGIIDSNMYGCLEFYNKCIENNIKPIIGIDITFENKDYLLYAKNYNGYVNLCNIVSIKNISGLTKENLMEKSNDLVCVTSIKNYEFLRGIYKTIYLSYSCEDEKRKCLEISKNIVYIKKVLYFKESDKEYLKYLYMIRDSKTISENVSYEIDNSLEKHFDDDSTFKFANLIDIKIPNYSFDLPLYKENNVLLLESLCRKGLEKRLNVVPIKYVERLKYELSVIKDMGFVDYFLIVYDYVLYAKKNNIIVGPGRGSAAGSLVSYTLGITEVDPLKYDLIFERFLNPGRVTMPDIDIDFDFIRRDEVINYVKTKYGVDSVANIITFGSLTSKQCIRDVGRVLEILPNEIDKIVNFIGDKTKISDLEKNVIFMSLINSKASYKKLFEVSKKIENLKRHSSIHAAGIVISSGKLMNKMPLVKSGNNVLTGYTMDYMKQLGLLKMDFLALKNLNIINDIIKLIGKTDNFQMKLSDIPLDDDETIELFKKVNTVGIFQFEKEGMKKFLRQLNVSSFSDIVSAIALYRPGPRENIPLFIKRKEGKEKITYIVPELESILKSTYGVIIYQEQIIEIMKKIGNFSYSEADIIRDAMSKKKSSIIEKYESLFIKGALENGISENKSKEIYSLVLKFANYGFNKSHSVAYSMIAFYLAYLKVHYKELFMINLLNSSIGSESKTKEYIDESKILGLNIIEPSVNLSINEYYVKNKSIVLPLGIIRNVGFIASTEIVKERENGAFTDYIDFIKRVYNSKVSIKVLESLIESGTLDEFKITRKAMLESLESVINYANLTKETDESLISKPVIFETDEYSQSELLEKEFKLFGFYLNNHPVTKYKRDNSCKTIDLIRFFDKFVNFVGLVENIKEIKTKNNLDMSFMTVSDEYKKVSAVLFPKEYEKFSDIKVGDVIKIKGKVEKRMSEIQIVVNDIEKLNIKE